MTLVLLLSIDKDQQAGAIKTGKEVRQVKGRVNSLYYYRSLSSSSICPLRGPIFYQGSLHLPVRFLAFIAFFRKLRERRTHTPTHPHAHSPSTKLERRATREHWMKELPNKF